MKKQISNIAILLVLTLTALMAMPPNGGPNWPVSAPLVGSTTISTAMVGSDTQVCLTSGTGVVTPSLSSGQVGSFLFINKEMLQVTGAVGASTTCFRVKRGQNGTVSQIHLVNSTAWIGNATTSTGDGSRPLVTGLFPMENANPPSLPTVQPAFGTTPDVTAPVSGTLYLSAIEVPFNRPVTGLCMLNGATAAGTDNHIFFIYDHRGNLLGQTAATATGSASLYQCVALATSIEISGPRIYYIGFQSNGTTDLVKKYITGEVGPTFVAGSVTGTSGTIPQSLAIPSTFTTAKGPIGAIY